MKVVEGINEIEEGEGKVIVGEGKVRERGRRG